MTDPNSSKIDPEQARIAVKIAEVGAQYAQIMDQPAPSRIENSLLADMIQFRASQIISTEAYLAAKKDDNVDYQRHADKLANQLTQLIAYCYGMLTLHGLQPNERWYERREGQAL